MKNEFILHFSAIPIARLVPPPEKGGPVTGSLRDLYTLEWGAEPPVTPAEAARLKALAKLDAVEVFHPDRMASRILGMGDVLSLIEKAEQNLDAKKAAEQLERLRKNKFTLSDFYDQLTQLKSMGGLEDIAGMIPGMGSKKLDLSADEGNLKRIEAIIQSMTPYERENPSVLNSGRKKRIAAGSGTQVVDVNRLLKEFNMMQQLTKQMGKLSGKRRKGKFGKFPGGMPFHM